MDAGGPTRTDGTRGLDAALLWALAAVGVGALGLRAWGLGHLPGINGDEAWFGVQMQELRAGLPAWRTPTGPREWIVEDYAGRLLLGVWRLEAAGELPAAGTRGSKP